MSNQSQEAPVAVVLGTRPEIIKLARVTQLLGSRAHVVHTGQHYDENLSDVFFTEFGMRPADSFIGVGGQTRGEQIGNGTAALDALFGDLQPAAVVVQGDTNAVAAGAIAANARSVPLVHVEAGLRSFDRRMPEEHNRIIADHLSDLALAATELNVKNLSAEGIAGDGVVLAGNPVVEAVGRLMPQSAVRQELLGSYELATEEFVLATFHRPENVDDPATLAMILEALGSIGAPVLLPLHPRTQSRISEFSLERLAASLQIVDPIGYAEFIGLGAESRLLVSDSGGVQEEVSVYKRPAVVVRRSTERQEVEGTFVHRVEPGPDLIATLKLQFEGALARRNQLLALPSPYGDERSPEKCVAAIEALIGEST
jgi:UDP-N-acetylglucosamine 2-epimerase (non-hydrolysing)